MAEQKPRSKRGAASESLTIRLTKGERRMIDNLVKRAQKLAGPGQRVTQRQVILLALESVSNAMERHIGTPAYAEEMRNALAEQESQEARERDPDQATTR